MKPFGVALVMALVAVAASAEVVAEDSIDVAKAAFAEGRALYEKGEVEAAAAAFRRANKASPSWKLFYNIGQCEAAAKRYGLAFEAFEAYLAQGGDEVPAERRDEVLAELERLRKMTGSLQITAPDGAVVLVDSMSRGTAPLPGKLKVAAGVNHQLVIKLGDDVLLERDLRVSSGDLEIVEALQSDGTLAGEGGAAQAVDETPPREVDAMAEQPSAASGRKIAGWVSIGVGSALVVAGSITGVGALKLDKDITAECSEQDGCLGVDRSDDVKKRDALALTTDILIGVGAATFVTGILFLTVFGRDEEPDAAALALIPIVGSDQAGAALDWRF
jgi:hypothetical protein